MTYQVCEMKFPEDMPKLEEMVYTVFLPDVPMSRIFNVDTRSPSPSRFPICYLPSKGFQDIYLKAVDSRGEIIGIAINKEHVVCETDSNTNKQWQQLLECLLFADEMSQVKNLPGRTVELYITSVHRDWRNLGVGRRLAEESMELARAAGFTTMKATCVSEYTAKMKRSLGWKEMYRMSYKDYPALSGASVTITAAPPHDTMYIYGTKL